MNRLFDRCRPRQQPHETPFRTTSEDEVHLDEDALLLGRLRFDRRGLYSNPLPRFRRKRHHVFLVRRVTDQSVANVTPRMLPRAKLGARCPPGSGDGRKQQLQFANRKAAV